MSDNADIGALLITIEEEGQGLHELEELLEQQTGFLVRREQRALLDNLSHQEKVLRKLGKLEEQRLRLLEELVSAGRLRTPPARLVDLAHALPDPEQTQIIELTARISGLARDIQHRENRNRRLIEAGRRCLDGFIELLIAPREQHTYGQSPGDAPEPRFFSSEA